MEYETSKNLLEESIIELRKIEPFWDRCFPCNLKGICCQGADLSVYDSEWESILEYIAGFSSEDKKVLLTNVQQEKHCVFRAENNCLIHEVRPENCRYTPFQCLVTQDNYLKYAMVSDDCSFQYISLPLNDDDANLVRESKFIILRNFEKETHYLSLNYQVQQCPLSENSRHVSDLLDDLQSFLKSMKY